MARAAPVYGVHCLLVSIQPRAVVRPSAAQLCPVLLWRFPRGIHSSSSRLQIRPLPLVLLHVANAQVDCAMLAPLLYLKGSHTSCSRQVLPTYGKRGHPGQRGRLSEQRLEFGSGPQLLQLVILLLGIKDRRDLPLGSLLLPSGLSSLGKPAPALLPFCSMLFDNGALFATAQSLSAGSIS